MRIQWEYLSKFWGQQFKSESRELGTDFNQLIVCGN